MTTRAEAQQWFLQWSSSAFGLSTTDGRPWGDSTAMAARESATTGTTDPWDEDCEVVPLIGGYETLCQIADTLQQAIDEAGAIASPGSGHVYITDWRLNPLRDMSRGNTWKSSPWTNTQIPALDQTAIGLILKLMQVGVNVRVLVWLPVTAMRLKGMATHVDEHFYLSEIVAAEAKRLSTPERGIVGLDSRVADPLTATHHQKMCVIRVGAIDVAFVGGVDWAFTRRDAPADPTATGAGIYHYDPADLSDVTKPPPQFLNGDWQSGTTQPVPFDPAVPPSHRWPNQSGIVYDAAASASRPGQSDPDLPANVYGNTQQIWHDQHFKLLGPIVQTIEQQFVERWSDAGDLNELGIFGSSHWTGDQVIFGQKAGAYDANGIITLPTPQPATSTSSSYVQMWRTIPLRKKRKTGRLSRGEFTIMAGISHATTQATQLIWLFDQYFFSEPLARLLNQRLIDAPNLHVIVVLPPFADTSPLDLIHLRKLALNDLVSGRKKSAQVYDRVAVYNTWHPGRNQGIYVHAKAKMFDDKLVAIGSGNLNRRSFTCDTELDCAVLDTAVVELHQQRLWKCLFPSSAWPLTSPRTTNWGKTFFDSFATAAAKTDAFLIKDPWDTETFTSNTHTVTHHNSRGEDFDETVTTITITPPVVPTKPAATPREQSYRDDFRTAANAGTRIDLQGQKESETPIVDMNALIEPTSLDLKVERVTSGKAGDPGPAGRLDEIVYLIEGVAGSGSTFPFQEALSMADDFVSGLLQAAEDLVAPLKEAVASPEDLSALLADLGWTSPLLTDAANVFTAFPQLFTDIENAVEQVAQADESGSFSPSQIEGLIGDAISAITALTAAIDGLTSPKGLGPPFDDAFWAAFPEELLDLLVCRFLADDVPKLYGLLLLAGIVTEQNVVPDPTEQFRVPYLERKVHWDRLPTAATDPASLMGVVYGWDTATFDSELFLRNTVRLLASFGLPGSLDQASTALDPYYPPGTFDRQYLSELVVPVLTLQTDDGTALGLAQLSLHALPIPPKGSTGLPSGFALYPEIDGLLSSGAIQIADGVTITVTGEFHTDPIVVEVRPTGADVTTGLATFDAEATLAVAPAKPLIMLGTAGSSRFELAQAHAKLGAKGPTGGELEFLIGAGLDSAALVIDLGEGDGFLQKLLGGQPQSLTLGVGVEWSSVSGFRFQGQAKLAVELPVHLTILDVLEIDTIGIVVGADTSGQLTLEATVTGGLSLGPFNAEVDKIGAKLALVPKSDNSGNLGAFNLGFGFRPPNGLGFVVDAGPVIGGGYVFFDPDNEEYAGVLQLEFSGTFALKAIGLLTTKMPDGSEGFSMMLIITAEFSPIQLGYGFTLNGVGGTLGINRTMDTGVLTTGIHSGALESLLFPPDPVAHATEVISNLRAAFPVAEGRFIFGPMAKIGWGASIITLELGILLELPMPIRLVLLGRLEMALPEAEDAVVVLQLDVLGIIDFGTGDISIDATLFDSRVVDFPITGDLAVRANVGSSPDFALAAGGFHPRFTPPPNFPPKMKRLGIVIASGDNPRLILGSYFALTTNTAQVGASIDAYAGFDLGALGTFSVGANLTFDALFHFVPFSMDAVLDGMASIKHNGDDLAGAKIHLEFSGPTPWHAVGTATVEFWGSHDVHVELTVGADAPAPAPAPADPGALLIAEIGLPRTWGTVAPDSDHALVTVRDLGAGGPVVVHPLGQLSVHQRVAPLGVVIQRIGSSPVPGGVTLEISSVAVSGVTTIGLSSLDDDFAPAQFFDLSDDDKLSRPAFETLGAGARVQTDGFARGGNHDAELEYETVVVDDRATAPAVATGYKFRDEALHSLAEHGVAGGSTLTQAPRFTAPSAGIAVTGPAYVVVGRDDFAHAPFAGGASKSYSAAADKLAAHLASHPADESAYQVVALHEAA